MTQQVMIYGKGGSGKTTIAVNLAAALAEAGKRVLLIGCSPTADSSHLLLGEDHPATISSLLPPTAGPAGEELVATGYGGVGCIEVGDLQGANACPASSVAMAVNLLRDRGVVAGFAPDFVILDLPGEPGCLGGGIPRVVDCCMAMVVAAANYQSIYAANRCIEVLSRYPYPLALVANGSSCSFEDALIADFARQAGVRLATAIPRSLAVRHCEMYGKTVVEAAPLSIHAHAYRALARLVSAGVCKGRATPLNSWGLKAWAREWGERLGELEFGMTTDGGGI